MAPRPADDVESDDEPMIIDSVEDKQEKNSNNDAESDGGEEASEYEIEAILDAKRGAFPEGRMGYLVKWKGYGEEENSWVDELDTGNAKELITEFWRKNPKKKPRKSEPKPAKRGRKSVTADEESDSNSIAKKRSRKSTVRSDSEEIDAGAVIPASIKKTKKVAEKNKAKTSEEPAIRLHDMSKYMHVESWEDMIDTVETVERTEDGLVVYFTLKNGDQVQASGDVCRKRCPQKLLSFYESNLKWRIADGGDS